MRYANRYVSNVWQTDTSSSPPTLFGVNSWIAQMIRQWIPDCWSGDRKCTGPKSAAANSRNSQSCRSKMLWRPWTSETGTQ